MVNEQRLLQEFLRIVQIDSETTKERAIIDYLKETLQNLEFDIVEDEADKKANVGAGNLILTIPGNVEHAKRLLFTAHVDTVTPGQGIEPIIKEGYIYSKGNTILGADDKAGIAAIIEMARTIKEKNIPHGQIQIILTVGEECGLLGAKNINQDLLDSDMGIALDSNGDVGRIVIQGPVQFSVHATITGKAAHAGVNPEAGISAIEVAADAISTMKLGRIDQDTTANIGVIQGGQATNIVCETLTIKGEARSLDRQKLLVQVEHMQAKLQEAAKKRNAHVAIEVNEEYPEFCFSVHDDEVKLVKKAMVLQGLQCNCVSSGGGSDASIFNGYGIKTLNLGIGMENMHSVDERIKIEQLYKTANLLLEIIKVACQEK